MTLRRVNAGRYEAGPWSIVHVGPKFWTLLHRNHAGARGDAVIDNFASFADAKAAFLRESSCPQISLDEWYKLSYSSLETTNQETDIMAQKLILDDQMAQLVANGKLADATGDGSDFKPVVKFFTAAGACTWLISEISDDGDSMFGLCDLGMGTPELGYVSLSELRSVRDRLGLPVERDEHFKPDKTISNYAKDARHHGRITT